MTGRDHLRAVGTSRPASEADGITYGHKGELILPEMPAPGDVAGLCRWLTITFNLDTTHPITGGRREGNRGPDGHVALTRAGAPPIRFEPASRINAAPRLIETLSWMLLQTDGEVLALKGDHCRKISYAIRMLCAASDGLTAAQEADGVIGTLMMEAVAVEGHTTYGTSGQRYEAAIALRRELDSTTGRPIGPRRYLLDGNTGEYVVAVSDAQEAARRRTGGTVPHGWLDARLDALGWTRVELQGFGQPTDTSRRGPHARIYAYRGHLAHSEPIDEPNT